ncbi:hypothetical protein EVJ58_g10226 [Rhodofomes roseus]|uniref:Uncharacterized protein n=1 Tax=Rhodofomes roseus TaxID=34475 RepID=A0A4Y9XP22_9APHY|nr:hypothetical protein EVJ58_g10226 [Rhodofomes roseus]
MKQTREDLLEAVDEVLSAASTSSRSRSSRVKTARTELSDQENSASAPTEQALPNREVERVPCTEQPEPTVGPVQSHPETVPVFRTAPAQVAKPDTTPKGGARNDGGDTPAPEHMPVTEPAPETSERDVESPPHQVREGIGTQPYVVYRGSKLGPAAVNIARSETSCDIKYIHFAPNDAPTAPNGAYTAARDALDPDGVERHEPASRARATSGSARRAALDSHLLDRDRNSPPGSHHERPPGDPDARVVLTDARARIRNWLAELPVQLAARGDLAGEGRKGEGDAASKSQEGKGFANTKKEEEEGREANEHEGSGIKVPAPAGASTNARFVVHAAGHDVRAHTHRDDSKVVPVITHTDTTDVHACTSDMLRDSMDAPNEGLHILAEVQAPSCSSAAEPSLVQLVEPWGDIEHLSRNPLDLASPARTTEAIAHARRNKESQAEGGEEEGCDEENKHEHEGSMHKSVATNMRFVVRPAGHERRTNAPEYDPQVVPETWHDDTTDAHVCMSDMHRVPMDAPNLKDDLKVVPSDKTIAPARMEEGEGCGLAAGLVEDYYETDSVVAEDYYETGDVVVEDYYESDSGSADDYDEYESEDQDYYSE